MSKIEAPSDPICAAIDAALLWYAHPDRGAIHADRLRSAIIAFLRALPEDWEPKGCPIPGACSVIRILADAVEKAATDD